MTTKTFHFANLHFGESSLLKQYLQLRFPTLEFETTTPVDIYLILHLLMHTITQECTLHSGNKVVASLPLFWALQVQTFDLRDLYAIVRAQLLPAPPKYGDE